MSQALVVQERRRKKDQADFSKRKSMKLHEAMILLMKSYLKQEVENYLVASEQKRQLITGLT